MTYAPLVKYIVFKKVRELPARCEVEDFISCGLEALIASIDRYDPEKGATLEQFAWTRIHGAVLDELRRQDWAPRSLRRWERDIHKAREQFTRSTAAVRRATSWPRCSPSRSRSCAAARTTSPSPTSPRSTRSWSPTTRPRSSGSTRSPPATPASIPSRPPTAQAGKDKFRRAFDALPQREREVAVLLYVKNLTLREIGDILGVSESRVCQIHSQLKRTLKQQLSEDALLFSAVG